MNSRSKLFLAILGWLWHKLKVPIITIGSVSMRVIPFLIPKMGFSKAPIKVTDSRQLREFSIKDHMVLAFSKKDAIAKLKYQKKK